MEKIEEDSYGTGDWSPFLPGREIRGVFFMPQNFAVSKKFLYLQREY